MGARTEQINRRIRNGETVATGEVIDAVVADTTLADLRALAARLTEQSGLEHGVYNGPRGPVVYPTTYEQTYADLGVALRRI